MRTLAIGDIHGCLTALQTLAEIVSLTPDDQLITLGDYCDRGPNTRGVLDWLIHRSINGGLVAIRGNHDIMMMEARYSPVALERWLHYGGDAALASYSQFGEPGRLADVPDDHWAFLESTRRYHETQTHFFVHANVDPDSPLGQQSDDMLFWEKFRDAPPHESGKTMVCGHTSQKSGRPRDIGHAVCIDTWVYGQGWLTCLDVDTGQYWQANEKGETRADELNSVIP